jgi:tetratricopeptide (TPR) repeat protein
MDEERSVDDLEEEEYEDLDKMDEFSLEMEVMTDLEGLEELPEDQETGLAESDVIITYGDKVVDETKELEKKFEALLIKVREGNISESLNIASNLLNEGRRLDAHYITSKISSLIASLLTSQSKHKDATEYFLLSVSEARKSEDKKLHLLSLSRFGDNLVHFDFKDAAVVYNQARELAEELGEDEYYAENSYSLANCMFKSEIDNALNLYTDSLAYFVNTDDLKSQGLIKYRIGLINYIKGDYQSAFQNLSEARKLLKNFSDLPEFEETTKALRIVMILLKQGLSTTYFLNLPKLEPLVDTPGTKKIFEIYTSTGITDIVRRIKKEQLQFVSKDLVEIDVSKPLLDMEKLSMFNEFELLENSKHYESIGDFYQKELNYGNAFYNYLGSQILALHGKNDKRFDKLEKKLEKYVQFLTQQEEDASFFYNVQIYMHYQLAMGSIPNNLKAAQKHASKGIELASKRNNPYYEGLLKEILADIKAMKDSNKALADYQAVVSVFEELNNLYDSMRIFDKIGDILITTQTDKGKEYFTKALEIAKEIEDQEMIVNLESKL